MIASIARKEFLAGVLTYRFALAFGACAVLMGLSAYALVDEYALRVEDHEVEVVRARAELDNIKVYAQLLEYPPFTHRPPSPLSIFGEGLEGRLDNVLHFSHGSVPTLLAASQNSNPLMHAFPVFDLATISALLLSLVALFFAYDSVSGERQAGTLALLLSNPVPRAHLLLGKWLGGLACTGLPVVAGFGVALLVAFSEPAVHFTGDEWLRIALILLATLLYASVFYLLGLCLSVHVDRPATGLVMAISIWAVLTVVLPTGSAYLVGELMPMEGEREAREVREGVERDHGWVVSDLMETMREEGLPLGHSRYGQFSAIGSGFYRELIPKIQALYGEREPKRIRYAEKIGRLDDQILADRIAQVRLDRTIHRILMTPAFPKAVAALAGTDLSSYHGFIQHARRCRQDLVAWLRETGTFSSPRYFTPDDVERVVGRQELRAYVDELRSRTDLSWAERGAMTWDILGVTPFQEWDQVDLSRLPAFARYRPTLWTVLPHAAVDLALLGLANVLLLMLAVHGFLRREVV